jgi:hypothetical protein
MNGDGCSELITNEMLGNGVSLSAEDVGNLIVINGKSLFTLPLFSGTVWEFY